MTEASHKRLCSEYNAEVGEGAERQQWRVCGGLVFDDGENLAANNANKHKSRHHPTIDLMMK